MANRARLRNMNRRIGLRFAVKRLGGSVAAAVDDQGHSVSGGPSAAIDNLRLARLARLAGAPMDKGAGVDLLKKVGDLEERSGP